MLIVAPAEGFNSLVSLEDAQQYMVDFGHEWVVSDAAQEITLRKATQFLLARYGIAPAHLSPVHPNVQAACCEAAIRAGALLKDSDGRVMVEQTVDVLTTKWTDNGQGGQMRFPVIDALMRGLTVGGSNSVKLVRG